MDIGQWEADMQRETRSSTLEIGSPTAAAVNAGTVALISLRAAHFHSATFALSISSMFATSICCLDQIPIAMPLS